MKSNNWLALFIIAFFVFTVSVQLYVYNFTDNIISQVESEQASGRASSAEVKLCINHPPSFNNTCPTNTSQNSDYYCKINGSDIDNSTLIFSSVNVSGMMLFNISSSGIISFNPNDSYVGDHLINISLDDNSGCSNSVYSELFNISVININDPPYLEEQIPDQEFEQNVMSCKFYLDDYFTDPDGDELHYPTIFWDPSYSYAINITIYNNSQVCFYSSQCVESRVQFYTEERYTAERYDNVSNWVLLKVNCATQNPSNPESGGGAGGGSGNTRTCEPDWQCGKWGACMPNGTRTKRCIDMNGCDANNYIKYLIEECDYPQSLCQPEWDCTDWGPCLSNGTQIRNCTDKNNCNITQDPSELVRNCTYRNQTSVLEEPDILPPIEENLAWLTRLIIIILLLIVIAIIVYRYFKKQIKEAIARLGWYLTKKQPKEVLISDEAKDRLLKNIHSLEKGISARELEKSAVMLAGIARDYFKEALRLEYEFSRESFDNSIEKSKISSMLKKLLQSIFATTYNIEFAKYKVLPYELLVLIDELRLIIFHTSNAVPADGEKQVKTRKTVSANKVDQLFTLISNSMIATQFKETVFAKKRYFSAMRLFEDLKLSEQERTYQYINRLYTEINYVMHLVS